MGVSNNVSKVLQRNSSKSGNGNGRRINSSSSNETNQVLSLKQLKKRNHRANSNSKRIDMTGFVLGGGDDDADLEDFLT